MRFGKLDIDPAKSPAVLDTATWDRAAAGSEILGRRDDWSSVRPDALRGSRGGDRAAPGTRVHPIALRAKSIVLLAELPDAQKVFLQIGEPEAGESLGEPFLRLPLAGGRLLAAYPADAAVIDSICRALQPSNAPRAFGRTPRLGIGARMTTLVWPGIFAAMDRKGFSANCIQNSVRELNLLDDLKQGKEPERNYASGFGMIESGYTGSTFEGLWVAGVLAALRHERPLAYGADADHIQIKRDDRGLARAFRVIDAARYYTFFTLDPADILSYESLGDRGRGEELLRMRVTGEKERQEILSYHASPLKIGRRSYRADPDMIGRCAGKFWNALEAVGRLSARISALRPGARSDLEFAFDEHPPEIGGPECISTEAEVIFVAREIARRGLPVTHLAPNFGVEKGCDYRLADGLPGLGKRVSSLFRIAEELGFMLDVHSADDLSSATRRAIGRATGGSLHFKISPFLHFLFSETVKERSPEIFLRWWDDALDYARTEAEKGSPIARESLSDLQSSDDPSPSPGHEVFRQFFFAFLGRRDAAGHFVNREMFYGLSDELAAAYQRRVEAHLCQLAEELFEREE